MKTNILFSLLCIFLITACSSNYNIYVSNPKNADSDIFGYKLASFFDENNDILKSKIKNHNLFENEMDKIKNSLLKTDALPLGGEKFGVYKYAFIVNNDTLYSDATLSGWRYKNKVGKYVDINPILKNEILQILK